MCHDSTRFFEKGHPPLDLWAREGLFETVTQSDKPAIPGATETMRELVQRAQRANAPAFEQLVRRFQDAAVAYAWGVLRDRLLAEDAAQEAFLEAYLELGKLQDPGAFAPWLRAIVFSKCTRITRRKELGRLPAHDSASLHTPDPVELHVQAEQRRQLLHAVEALPDNERTPVTLFYMAEMNQESIGEFLGVPVSTVKNRLSTARKRLKGILMKDLERELGEQRPSRDERFQRRVALFRAVDADDANAVERLLKDDPLLVHERRRPDEEAAPGVHSGVTALHWACQRGRRRIAEALLDAGADLEARAGDGDHPDGGTALHFAAGTKRRDIVELLVSRGANLEPPAGGVSWASEQNLWADPEIMRYLVECGAKLTIFSAVVIQRSTAIREMVRADPSVLLLRTRDDAGMTPLHVGANENLPAMVDLLLDCGAPLDERDQLGRIAIDLALMAGNRAAYDRLAARGASPTPEALERCHSIQRSEVLRRVFELCVQRAWFPSDARTEGHDLAELDRMFDAEPWLVHAKLPTFGRKRTPVQPPFTWRRLWVAETSPSYC